MWRLQKGILSVTVSVPKKGDSGCVELYQNRMSGVVTGGRSAVLSDAVVQLLQQ